MIKLYIYILVFPEKKLSSKKLAQSEIYKTLTDTVRHHRDPFTFN